MRTGGSLSSERSHHLLDGVLLLCTKNELLTEDFLTDNLNTCLKACPKTSILQTNKN